jgi:NADH:ubiquinone oxidoreductase subunit H
MSFTDIVTIQHNFGILSWFFLPSFLGFIVFLISTIAIFKNSDDFVFFSAEYTGMKFTMFKISEYILAILLCILTVILYFGGYMPPIPIFIADLFEKSKFLYPFILTCEQTFWLILKSLLLFSTVFVFSKAIPKYKTEDLANIIWKFLIPLSILNIFIVCFFKLKLGGLYVL